MKKRKDSTEAEFASNVEKIRAIIKDNDNFLFLFSPDPDAVGTSIAMGVFLRMLNKNSAMFLSSGFDKNLSFLLDIAKYNKIEMIRNGNMVVDFIKRKDPVYIIIDTPNSFLISDFNKIKNAKKDREPTVIEIDHHFGGDSEQIFHDSIDLYLKYSSTSEIMFRFFDAYFKDSHLKREEMFPRNIILSLLVGLCFDTQFGKYVVNREVYNECFDFLSESLKNLTWEGKPSNLKSAKQVFESINKMSMAKEKVLDSFVDSIIILDNVGLLIVPPVSMSASLSKSGDSTCVFSKLVTDLSNMVPEISGNIGILAYFDDISNLYFLKIRRDYAYDSYDLRKLEDELKDIFGENYVGGGGHPGATSFRISKMEREVFEDKVKIFHMFLVSLVKKTLNLPKESCRE